MLPFKIKYDCQTTTMSVVNITKVAQFKGHQDAIYAMDIDSSCGVIYSAGADGKLVKWNWPSDSDGIQIAQLPGTAYSLKIVENGKIYLGTSTGELLIVESNAGEIVKRVELHQGGLFDVVIHGDKMYTLGADGVLTVGNKDGSDFSKYKISEKSLRKGLVRENELWVACSDHMLRRIDLDSMKVIQENEGHRSSIFDILGVEGKIYSAGRDASIKMWSLENEVKQLKSVPAHMYTIHSLAYNPENGMLASGSMDKSIRLWDRDLKIIKEINSENHEAHTNAVNKVLWIDQEHLISCSDDKTIMLFHVKVK